VDLAKDAVWSTWALYGVTPRRVERERRAIWRKLIATPTDVLKEAAEQLNVQEAEWMRF